MAYHEDDVAVARAEEVNAALVELLPLWVGPSTRYENNQPVGPCFHDSEVVASLNTLADLIEALQKNEGPLVGLEMHSVSATTLDGHAHDVGDLRTWQLLAIIAGRPLPEAMPPEMGYVEYYDRYVDPGVEGLAERMGIEDFDRDRARRRMLGDDAPPRQEYEQ